MKKILYLALVLWGTTAGVAQTTKSTVNDLAAYAQKDTTQGWKHSAIANVTFGQTSLTNWVAGGDNTLSANFMLNASANYVKNLWFWDNNLLAEYGLLNSKAMGTQKSSDKLNINSVGGRKISEKWAVSALINFKTQFAEGYNYPKNDGDPYISTFMAPAYLDAALGFTFKPNANYNFFISPIAERATFVLDDSLSHKNQFGIGVDKKVYFETGAYLMANTKQTIAKDLDLISTLYMFTPYTGGRFGHFDVSWDVLLNYKLNKYFTATLNTTLRYYEGESVKVQFKEIFGLGLTYTF